MLIKIARLPRTHYTNQPSYLGDLQLIPIPYSLTRIPPADDNRGNLVVGATGTGRELSKKDIWICSQVGPLLKEHGVIFAGIDIIGDFLTEINITSPTGIRELDKIFDLNIAGDLFNIIEKKLDSSL